MCSYSARNFDFCQEKETGVPHACTARTAPELCVASYSVSNFDFCQEKETGVPHACTARTAPELCVASYSVSNFDFCQEKETGVPHACTAPELCVATLSGILTSVRKKKQACPMHALHLSCV